MSKLNVRKKFVALALSMTWCMDQVVYDSNVESVYDVIDSQGENVEILLQLMGY